MPMHQLEFKAAGLTPEQLRLPDKRGKFTKGVLIGAATVLAVIYSEGRAGVALNPVALAFGNRLVGDVTPAQSVFLNNNGRGTVRVSSINRDGTNSTDFLVASDGCSGATIESGNACRIEIRFLPQAAGIRTAMLVLNDDASDSPQTVRLSGNAVDRRDIAVVPGILNFGDIALGTNSIKSVQVINKGSAAVSITSLSFSGDAEGDFAAPPETCRTAVPSPGRPCTIAVRFTPKAEGSRIAMLKVSDGSGDEPHLVSLRGNGLLPRPNRGPPAIAPPDNPPPVSPKPAIEISRVGIYFGEREYGRPSDTQGLTITSSGTGPLHISSVNIEGKFRGDFKIVGQLCNSDLHPHESCILNIIFTPARPAFAFTAMGRREAELVIADDASGPHRVNLTGTALRPARVPPLRPEGPPFSVQPGELDFGQLPVGQSQTKSVTVTNTSSDVQVIAAQLAAVGQDAFSLRGNSCRLDPQRSCPVSVVFAPQVAGNYRANLSLSAAGASTQGVTVLGSAPSTILRPFSPRPPDFRLPPRPVP